MSTSKQPKILSPKKLQILQRPGRILNVARSVMDTEGYASLTIERIAKEMDCSRPPIYEMFESREDIVMGLAIEDAIQRWMLLKKAFSFQGEYREKIMVMNEFFNRTYPEHLKILAVLQPHSIRQKASEKSRETLEDYESRSFGFGVRTVEDAVKAGDLVLPEGVTCTMIAYAMFCLSFGAHNLESRQPPNRPLHQIELDIRQSFNRGMSAMLDGFSWKPMSQDWEYAATIERAHQELDITGYIEKTKDEKPSSANQASLNGY